MCIMNNIKKCENLKYLLIHFTNNSIGTIVLQRKKCIKTN